MRAVWVDCTLHRCTVSATTDTSSAATLFLSIFVPSIHLCVSPMPVPRLFPRVVHSVCYTLLSFACLFPVPWFLRYVSCVMCTIRVDLFYPPCISLPFLLTCCASLCVPVSCSFLGSTYVMCVDSGALCLSPWCMVLIRVRSTYCVLLTLI